MRYAARLERLEAIRPVEPQRVILVWVDREGRRTKVADPMPHLPDGNAYDAYAAGVRVDAS